MDIRHHCDQLWQLHGHEFDSLVTLGEYDVLLYYPRSCSSLLYLSCLCYFQTLVARYNLMDARILRTVLGHWHIGTHDYKRRVPRFERALQWADVCGNIRCYRGTSSSMIDHDVDRTLTV
jgi:hypothetical protein